MDVSKTVKINKLAKELLKHGLVNSMDEGVENAAKQVDKEEARDLKETQKDNESDIDPKILERKLNYLATSFAEQFNTEMNGIKKQIDMLKNDLDYVKQKLKADIAQASEKPTEEPQVENKEDKPKPRTGDLTPNDVKVEDYFYFGNKK